MSMWLFAILFCVPGNPTANKTGSVSSSILSEVCNGIFAVVFVAMRAVCFLRPKASAHIDSVAYGFEVRWINADGIAAQMIDFFSFGDRPVGQLIGKYVRQYKRSSPIRSASNTKVPISVFASEPRPTRIRASGGIHLLPKAVFNTQKALVIRGCHRTTVVEVI